MFWIIFWMMIALVAGVLGVGTYLLFSHDRPAIKDMRLHKMKNQLAAQAKCIDDLTSRISTLETIVVCPDNLEDQINKL